MKTQHSIYKALPILFGFFVMGFCDIVGISSDYVQRTFDWSPAMTGFVPSLVFIWFLFLGIPIGNQMNKWGRKNTVLLSMAITVVGMLLPLIIYNSATCMIAYAFLGIGNAILQVSLNPLLSNVVTSQHLLTSSLTAGQVIKAVSSLVGPEIVLLAVAHFGDDKWYYCFPILGFITLLSAVWLIATPIKREDATAAKQQLPMSDTFLLLKDKTILLLFLGIFFIVGVDVATNFMSSKLMAERFDWTTEQVKFAPQVYFLSRTIGALLSVFFLARIAEMKYFRVNIIACLLSLLILAFVKDELINLICIGAVGFFGSSVFSIIYSMALQARPEKANQISGLMITAVAGGGAVTPIIGIAIGKVGVIGGVFVTLVCVGYLTYCAFGIKTAKN
ncbi:sugar MFS transporter [Bacteroides sp.]|uniref:MFS transporter n=1 Tax=Bacteroides sp. TaxID=29523 RepID=UPI0026326C99|nr:MFS transporter [Bacteroides sp.]MDD3040248.1 MFS transporter [Bacteroides sp.]